MKKTTLNKKTSSRKSSWTIYALAVENKLTLKPTNVAFEAAAAIPVAGLNSLQILRDSGRIKPEKKVLTNGVSSGVGTFAVRIADGKGHGNRLTASN